MAKTIRQSRIRKALDIICDVRLASTMETANFTPTGFENKPLPSNQSEVDEFIKDKTKLFRESWITDPIDTAINILISELNR